VVRIRRGCTGQTCDCRRCVVARTAWSIRPGLLAIAYRRTGSRADAEDIVSEALTRALESDSVDPDGAARWLTAVTVRLCVDRARDLGRWAKRSRYAVLHQSWSAHFYDEVVDRLYAEQVTTLLHQLAPEHLEVLRLRAEAESLAAIGDRLGVSAKAAESLLGRARTAARAIVA